MCNKCGYTHFENEQCNTSQQNCTREEASLLLIGLKQEFSNLRSRDDNTFATVGITIPIGNAVANRVIVEMMLAVIGEGKEF